jgi:D-alanyl-D-alanine dipeptidase
MYFQLNNIPYWKGAYMIKKVNHSITAGNMSTSFEGIRVNRYAIPASDGAVAIHKTTGGETSTTASGGTPSGGGTPSVTGPSGGVGGSDIVGNPNLTITDVIDFNVANITEMKPLICITPAHGPKSNKHLEWGWSTKVVDKMVSILKSYKYKDGTPYNVQRCNKGGNHTGKGYSMIETRNLVKKYGSKKVISLVPHWNGCGQKHYTALKGGKDDFTREDSIKLMECVCACAKEVKAKSASFTTMPKGAMDGSCSVVQFPARKKDDGTISYKSCDGATQQDCACALTENWFADYPKGCNWAGANYKDKDSEGRFKTMRAWLESDEGVQTIAEINAKGIKKYIDYINANGLINVSGKQVTPAPQANYEEKTLEEYIKEGKMVDVTKLGGSAANIKVDIRYSTSNNIFKGNVYGDLRKAYLAKNFANKIVKAQEELEKHNATAGTKYTLIIWDAVRPNSIQIKAYKDPRTWPSGQYGKAGDKSIFGKPKGFKCPDGTVGTGSLHSYGVAVDLSIYDKSKNTLLNMGTDFDSTDKAKSAKNASASLIGKEARANRDLLFKVMSAAGLIPISNEWWHFQESFGGKTNASSSKANGYYVK